MPKITVIVTTYNIEMLIAECFDELLTQTFQDFNILVIDDASTDNTPGIISEYRDRHPGRFQTIFIDKNMGSPSLTRNAALDSGMVDGEYLIFLDGDDRIEQDFLETLYNMVLEYQAEIAVCAYERVVIETGYILCVEMQGFPKVIDVPPYGDIPAFINSALWNKLIKVSLIGEHRLPPFRVGEDLCFFCSILQGSVRIAFTDKILVHYQVRKISNISTVTPVIVYALADELHRIYSNCDIQDLKDTLELIVFIHIGLSMPIRIKNNPDVSTRKHLIWTREYLYRNFNMFRGSRFLRLASLKQRGARGYMIRMALLLYKWRTPGLFLLAYTLYTKALKKDVKF